MAVIFADGLAPSGISESDSRTVWTVKTMMRQSAKNMLLIDHFRFGREGLHRICGLEELDVVVSDRRPDRSLTTLLRERGVRFLCV